MEVLLPLLTAIATAFLAWQGVRHWRLARLIATTPTTPIAQVRPGPIEVQGRVEPAGEALLSPPTSTPCVYYRYQVQERREDGGQWRTIQDDERFARCQVVDETGAIEVDLRAARLDLHGARHRRTGMVRATRRWYLTLLEPQQEVYVLGEARIRDGQPRVVPAGDLLLVSDRHQDRLIAEHRFHAALYAAAIVVAWSALVVAIG